MSEGNGRERELGVIQATLVSIQAQIAEGNEGRRRLHEKMDATRDELKDVKGDVAAVKKAVDEMAPHVQDWRDTKAKGWGILAGAALAGGGATALISKLLAKVGLSA